VLVNYTGKFPGEERAKKMNRDEEKKFNRDEGDEEKKINRDEGDAGDAGDEEG
jgi:hypothetical protein